MDLERKAIERIKLGALMSEQYYNKPLICTYSGGKDSDVMLELFIRSGVKFEVINSHTTVDAPQTVYHIREKFKELEDKGIKATITYPTYKGKRTSMWDLIVEKAMPPTRTVRYCCQVLKESNCANRAIATGVRWEESSQRKSRNEFEAIGSTKKKAVRVSKEELLDTDNTDARRIIERCELKGRMVINPIIDWKERDIWNFIRENNIKYNPLYDMGYSRVGCIGCPMAGFKCMSREFRDFPIYKQNYIKAFDRMLEKRKADGKETTLWKTGEDVMTCLLNEKNYIKGQMNLFEGEEE